MERILQLGTGRFLRGFVDVFVDDLEQRGAGDAPARRVTAVETSGSGMAARLAATGCAYPVLIQGVEGGRVVDERRVVRVVDRVLDASTDPSALVEAALDPDLRMIVSNVTEAGYVPDALPARLAAALVARAWAGLPGIVVVPLELIERNGDRLRDLVTAEVGARGEPGAVTDHVRAANAWAVTMVDRIASRPRDGTPEALDPLAVAVEPYAAWVVELPGDAAWPLPSHPSIERVADVGPYALRKIRLLNGAHTALVARCRGTGITLVRGAMADPGIATWLEALLREELVPALGDRIVDGQGFVTAVLERFRNPFLDHRLADIAVGHADKLRVRLVPTFRDHVARLGRPPVLLGALLAGEGVSP